MCRPVPRIAVGLRLAVWRVPIDREVYVIKVWRAKLFSIGALHWYCVEDILEAAPLWWQVTRAQSVQCLFQILERASNRLALSTHLLFKRSRRGAGADPLRCFEANTLSTTSLLLFLSVQSCGGEQRNDSGRTELYADILKSFLADALGGQTFMLDLHPSALCDVTIGVPKLGQLEVEVTDLQVDLSDLGGGVDRAQALVASVGCPHGRAFGAFVRLVGGAGLAPRSLPGCGLASIRRHRYVDRHPSGRQVRG